MGFLSKKVYNATDFNVQKSDDWRFAKITAKAFGQELQVAIIHHTGELWITEKKLYEEEKAVFDALIRETKDSFEKPKGKYRFVKVYDNGDFPKVVRDDYSEAFDGDISGGGFFPYTIDGYGSVPSLNKWLEEGGVKNDELILIENEW